MLTPLRRASTTEVVMEQLTLQFAETQAETVDFPGDVAARQRVIELMTQTILQVLVRAKETQNADQ